ncbi:DUF6221 family protein [Streptomyces sp. RB13]|uniref:DUF6221 family protein n=1 Tax=Streptomyces sp. RB13 TaxID=2950978 RepID=UPI002FCC185D
MDDLVQWLRAQLDADERIAHRAGDSFRQIGATGVIVATEGDRAEECASANWAGIAEHIVAHDPARVLREIDAKRQVIDLHAPGEMEYVDGDVCMACDVRGGEPFYPCKTLRLLALPYADRPGYRDEWRP